MVFFQISSQRDTVKKQVRLYNSSAYDGCFVQSKSREALHDPLPIPQLFSICLPLLLAFLLFLKHGRHALGSSYLLFSLSKILFSQNPQLTPFRFLLKCHLRLLHEIISSLSVLISTQHFLSPFLLIFA